MKLADILGGALALLCVSASNAWAQYGPAPSPYGQPASPYGQPASPYGPPASGGQGPGLSAGGLAPPAPLEEQPTAGDQQTTARLAEADREDSGRGLEFLYLNGEAGVTYLGLQTFESHQLVDARLVATSGVGPTYGAGVGVRLVFLTLGGRFRLMDFADYQLWTLGAELGLRIPLGAVEPYFTVGAGYAKLGAFDGSKLSEGLSAGDVSAGGYDLRAGLGVDVYLSNTFSLGAVVSGELLGLSREGVQPKQGSLPQEQEVYARDGSSVGGALSAMGVVGLHF